MTRPGVGPRTALALDVDLGTAWMARAECRADPDPELWFSPAAEDVAAAKAVCRTCLVQVECGAFALATDSVGVWAATTTEERARRVRRAQRQARVA